MRVLGFIVAAFCATGTAYADLKDKKRASIINHAKKWTGRHTATPQSNLVTDKISVVEAVPSTSEEIDGASYFWHVGNWSDCSADCGPGVKQRVVECVNQDTSAVEDDSVCQQDASLGPNSRPIDTDECEGPCIKCDDRTDLFRSIGLSPPPMYPVRSRTNEVCHVTDPKNSCCDRRVENSMITQAAAIQKGFRAVPDQATQQQQVLIDYISNSTQEFQERLEQTQTQLQTIAELLATPTNLKGDKKLVRALNVVHDVMEQRIVDLQNAILNSTAITTAIQNQLGVLSSDTSLDISTAANVSSARKPTLTNCVNSTVGLFASLGCAACNPTFVQDNMDSHGDGLFNSINISTAMCTDLFKQCSPTVRDSRRYLRSALQIMRSIHSNLARSAARLQPALLALWSEISFDWLPGSTHPIAADPFYAGVDTYVPDVTTLDCIKDSSVYTLPPASKVDDFCANFFENWNYQFTINNMLKDIKVGVQAMGALQRCDKCVHMIASKVGDILINGKGGLDVTLRLSKEALAEAGCAGLSSTPTKKAAISIKEQLMTGKLNLFAVKEGDEFTQGERSNLAGKSKRAMFMILAAMKVSARGVTTDADKTAQALASNFTYIRKLEYTDHGMDPTSWANVSWDVIQNSGKNPPPSIWEIRQSSEVGIIATDFNCTSHLSCNPESGDAPYWFCANVKVCNGTIPCDDTEKDLLMAHPRCVKGLCVDGRTAVDGKCPDIAICPQTKTGQFDHFYFSKFKSVAPMPPPSSDLVSQEGAEMASAITRAMSYASGVCDCAFTTKIDEKGLTSLQVGDKCQYAQCLAYAIANEPQPNCQAALSKQCADLKSICPTVDCDKVGAQWNVPQCEAGNDGSKMTVLASDTRSAGRTVYMGMSVVLLVLTSLLVVL